MSFHQKLEFIQYNACFAITGAIRSASKEKLYQELGLESLQLRRWYRELGMSYKIFKSKSPQYLFMLIPGKTSSYITRNTDNITLFFRPRSLIGTAQILTYANQKILVFSKTTFLNLLDPNQFFNCNLKGIRLITRLRLELSHLREHNFQAQFPKLIKYTS